MKSEILNSRADGNRTIFHVAVMNSFATTNKEEADTMEISVDTENKPLQRLSGMIVLTELCARAMSFFIVIAESLVVFIFK